MPRVAAVALALSGCSWFSQPPVCAEVGAELAPAVQIAGEQVAPSLTCEQAEVATRYVSVVAGRPIRRAERALLLRDLGAVYRSDSAGVRADLQAMASALAELREATGLDAAQARSARAWSDLTTGGPLDRYPQGKRALAATVAVWASDDERGLVLTESDIEGWISYASLCREVQQGGPLKLSVAHR